MRLSLAPTLTIGALVLTTSTALAQPRYKNLVNTPFATLSSGPQSSVSLDVPVGATAKQTTEAVEKRLRREWTARTRALSPALRKQKGRGVFPLSTLVSVHQGLRLQGSRWYLWQLVIHTDHRHLAWVKVQGRDRWGWCNHKKTATGLRRAVLLKTRD